MIKQNSMFILRLIFLIVYCGSLKITAVQKPIQMVTLGRSFHLGMLYDIRSDKIITDYTLWDSQNLANNTSTSKQPSTSFEIITEDSLQNKARALGIEASLKLSLLGGLINTSGSAKYAEDYQRTNNEARLTLKYLTTTHFEELTIEHLGIGNLNHSDLHDTNLATHVVTGILYGAEAFFVFDRTISSGEYKKEIRNSLKVMIDKIPTFQIKNQAKLSLTNQEKNLVDKLRCKFYNDFHLSENLSTFTEAVRIYHQLPLLLGKNNENVIPKKVWLYPLNLLNNEPPIVRDISSNSIDYSISVIDKLHSLEIKALDLSKSRIFTHFNYMKKHLLGFIARLSEFQYNLKEKIALYLPKLRGDISIQESVLFNDFKQNNSLPFNQRKLELWLEEKRKEIALITPWIENLAKDSRLNIMNESSSLYEVIDDPRYEYLVCLSFRFVEENDRQLNDMHNYLYNRSNFKSSNSRKKTIKWFKDHRSIAKIRNNIQQFIEFAKVNNVENGNIKFIVDEYYSINHVKTTELIVYDHAAERKGFIIPSKPDAPYEKSVTDNSITLGWIDAANGTKEVIKYKVMYQKYSDEISIDKNKNEKEDKWIEVYTNNNNKELIISNLTSKTTFVFKVQAITAIGLSAISDLSEPIETLTNKEQNGVQINIPKISINTKWRQNGITVAGGNGMGSRLNQLNYPLGIYIDDDYTIYVADRSNHRIIKWKTGVTYGEIVAGGNGPGNRSNQLHHPVDVLINHENDYLIISDYENKRVVRWSRRNATNGETIIANIDCYSLAIDKNGYLYISDIVKQEVRRWKIGEKIGTLVAGGNGKGNRLDQFSVPGGIFVDKNHSVYVSDQSNHRVMKWVKDAKKGIIVAGGHGFGNNLKQLLWPNGIIVDQFETVYVADYGNNRVMRWLKGAKKGTIIVGGNGKGEQANQLKYPVYLSFNRQNNLYVVDRYNHRVQKFLINSPKRN